MKQFCEFVQEDHVLRVGYEAFEVEVVGDLLVHYGFFFL